jgi:predicted metalloprotease with PDZ domain
VILATGTVRVGSVVNDSVILGGSEVKVGVDLAPGNGQGVPVKNSVIRPHQRDPLDFIHFWDLAEQGIKVKASRQEVRVEEVTAGKCFAQAGVRKGDRLVAVEGVKVVSAEGLRRLLRRRIQESKVIRLEIRREEKQLQMDMHVSGDAP